MRDEDGLEGIGAGGMGQLRMNDGGKGLTLGRISMGRGGKGLRLGDLELGGLWLVGVCVWAWGLEA